MGTRSLTIIKDTRGTDIVHMYRQFDGYLDGHGIELYRLLAGRTIVNGFGTDTPPKSSNGMSCLAATVVAHFKSQKENEIGGIYLYPPQEDNEQEWNYIVYLKDSKLALTIDCYGKTLYDGLVDSLSEAEFLALDAEEDEDEEASATA